MGGFLGPHGASGGLLWPKAPSEPESVASGVEVAVEEEPASAARMHPLGEVLRTGGARLSLSATRPESERAAVRP
jgi:hypothetical protein